MDLLLHWELHLCRHMNEMLDAQWPCCISTVGFLNNTQILNSSMQLWKKDFLVPKGTKKSFFQSCMLEFRIWVLLRNPTVEIQHGHCASSISFICLHK